MTSLAVTGQAAAQHAPDVWRISDHYRCEEPTRRVATDIIVEAGGVLELAGCVLQMAAPPYEDQQLALRDEGLRLTVERGGSLVLEGLPGRPAGIERADARYGYTIRAYGNVSSIGLPAQPNFVRGLEGNDQGTLALGGFAAWGTVHATHTDWSHNSGPALVVAAGGRVVGSNLTFSGQGALSSLGGSVLVDGLRIQATFMGFVASRADEVRLSNCEIEGGTIAVEARGSNLTLSNCHLQAPVGVQSLSSDLRMAGSRVAATHIGVAAKPDARFGQRSTLHIEDGTFSGPAAATGVAAMQTAVTLQGVDAIAWEGRFLEVLEGTLHVHGARAAHPRAFLLTNPGSLQAQGVETPAPAFQIRRALVATVADAGGRAVMGAELRVGESVNWTSKDGQARLVWNWFEATHVTELPPEEPVRVAVSSQQAAWIQQLPPRVTAALILEPDASGAPPSWTPLAYGVLGASGGLAVYAARRRMGRADR